MDENGDDEFLRNKIREKIQMRMKINSNTQLDENMRKQLIDEIKREMLAEGLIQKEKSSIMKSIKKGIDDFINFINPPNQRNPHQHRYNDEEQAYQAQLRMAIELSKENMEPQVPRIEIQFEEVQSTSANSEPHIECGICFDTTSDPISYGCEHQFCVDCVTTNLNTAIKEGLIETMQCPDPSCKVTATQELVKRLVSEEMFKRYEILLLKSATADMDNIVYCSNGDCGAIIEAEIDIGFATCHKCGHCFCTNCSKPFHGFTDCELTEAERNHMIQVYQDELIAEIFFKEETRNQLAIEASQREDEERIKTLREEQNVIRLQEQIEIEEFERQQEEDRRLAVEKEREEKAERERERIEYERIVAQNEEKERRDRLKLEERRRQDMDSEYTVRQVSKPCPNCHSPIEKNGGCDHMKCTKCGYDFSWQRMGGWS